MVFSDEVNDVIRVKTQVIRHHLIEYLHAIVAKDYDAALVCIIKVRTISGELLKITVNEHVIHAKQDR